MSANGTSPAPAAARTGPTPAATEEAADRSRGRRHRPRAAPPAVAPPRTRRRTGVLAAGVALVALGALGAAYLAQTLGGTVAVVAVGVATAWVLVGKRDVPREAPRDVSFATRAARADIYGDAINDALVVAPGAATVGALTTIDRTVIDGTVEGGAHAVAGVGQSLRKVQTGFVRSYALLVVAGIAALALYFLIAAS